jgi:hypothetical protein
MNDEIDLGKIVPLVKQTGPFHCNFCGRSDREVKKIIAGPGVFICDECIELSVDIIREDDPEFASEVPQFDPKKAVFILDGEVVGYITEAIIHVVGATAHPFVTMHTKEAGRKEGWFIEKHGHTFTLKSVKPEEEA